ncbi:biopolymer transporter ExbD [bacterium]|nr:biopolymer transporter ExbD [Akkermansiaceae bacterium]MDA7536940.1 biopolymer transporter ExbD [bacterium]MDA7876455.1 biopolymer transporter ExbD [Akkermansiaceae bacterium]MDA8992156.1 biopolymer transporter ExbD [Akkermansiaceae bacterium]MDB4142828.1 biopolymer transporter ExbD [Akkermansiaceae bacterium]
MASNRLRAVNAGDDEEGKMDMSPMIDMVFLLLLFFLVVSNPKTIKIDPNVNPVIASAAQTPKSKYGKIVVNIHQDGSLRAENFDTVSLDDDAGLEAYIKEGKEAAESGGHAPVLHIRGDQDTVFKHCRKVIRVAARVGVSQVAFGGYINDK